MFDYCDFISESPSSEVVGGICQHVTFIDLIKVCIDSRTFQCSAPLKHSDFSDEKTYSKDFTQPSSHAVLITVFHDW